MDYVIFAGDTIEIDVSVDSVDNRFGPSNNLEWFVDNTGVIKLSGGVFKHENREHAIEEMETVPYSATITIPNDYVVQSNSHYPVKLSSFNIIDVLTTDKIYSDNDGKLFIVGHKKLTKKISEQFGDSSIGVVASNGSFALFSDRIDILREDDADLLTTKIEVNYDYDFDDFWRKNTIEDVNTNKTTLSITGTNIGDTTVYAMATGSTNFDDGKIIETIVGVATRNGNEVFDNSPISITDKNKIEQYSYKIENSYTTNTTTTAVKINHDFYYMIGANRFCEMLENTIGWNADAISNNIFNSPTLACIGINNSNFRYDYLTSGWSTDESAREMYGGTTYSAYWGGYDRTIGGFTQWGISKDNINNIENSYPFLNLCSFMGQPKYNSSINMIHNTRYDYPALVIYCAEPYAKISDDTVNKLVDLVNNYNMTIYALTECDTLNGGYVYDMVSRINDKCRAKGRNVAKCINLHILPTIAGQSSYDWKFDTTLYDAIWGMITTQTITESVTQTNIDYTHSEETDTNYAKILLVGDSRTVDVAETYGGVKINWDDTNITLGNGAKKEILKATYGESIDNRVQFLGMDGGDMSTIGDDNYECQFNQMYVHSFEIDSSGNNVFAAKGTGLSYYGNNYWENSFAKTELHKYYSQLDTNTKKYIADWNADCDLALSWHMAKERNILNTTENKFPAYDITSIDKFNVENWEKQAYLTYYTPNTYLRYPSLNVIHKIYESINLITDKTKKLEFVQEHLMRNNSGVMWTDTPDYANTYEVYLANISINNDIIQWGVNKTQVTNRQYVYNNGSDKIDIDCRPCIMFKFPKNDTNVRLKGDGSTTNPYTFVYDGSSGKTPSEIFRNVIPATVCNKVFNLETPQGKQLTFISYGGFNQNDEIRICAILSAKSKLDNLEFTKNDVDKNYMRYEDSIDNFCKDAKTDSKRAIVLLMGVNDIANNPLSAMPKIIRFYTKLVTRWATTHSNIDVYLSTIPPVQDVPINNKVIAYNQLLQNYYMSEWDSATGYRKNEPQIATIQEKFNTHVKFIDTYFLLSKTNIGYADLIHYNDDTSKELGVIVTNAVSKTDKVTIMNNPLISRQYLTGISSDAFGVGIDKSSNEKYKIQAYYTFKNSEDKSEIVPIPNVGAKAMIFGTKGYSTDLDSETKLAYIDVIIPEKFTVSDVITESVFDGSQCELNTYDWLMYNLIISTCY